MKLLNIGNMAVVALFLALAIFTGCSDEEMDDVQKPTTENNMVRVNLNLNGAFPFLKSRAAVSKPELNTYDPQFLPDSSTIQLIILKEDPWTNYDGKVHKDNVINKDAAGNIDDFVYIILADGFGTPYPYPCKVDKKGRLIEGTINQVPYYQMKAAENENTKYYCMAVSPARQLILDTDGYYKLAIKNQEEVLINNNDWTQTCAVEFDMPQDVHEVAQITPNPLMNATAKIRIHVKNGHNVTELIPGRPYVELDRVPTNPGIPWTGDGVNGGTFPTNKYNLEVGRSIEQQLGNNILYNRMYIMNSNKTESWVNLTPDAPTPEESLWGKNIVIECETPILPMDARPTPMIIRLNIDVNLTPMQFQYQTGRVFKPGHVYDYTATISLTDGDIYIASWQDMQWGDELTPIPN